MVICTRNRWQQLRRVLESAAAMAVPDDLSWELVLVDNGSTDDTRDVARSFSDRLPIRYVFEARAGLSNARNRGVSEALGGYICWTDDDVLIDPHWLQAYVSAFRRHPDAAVFGGLIEPLPETQLPAWWRNNVELLASILAKRDFGPDEIPLCVAVDKVPYGANFAVRTAEQRQIAYDACLGVGPGFNRLGEETDVIEALLQAGTGVWVPDAKVKHIIPAHRLTMSYVAKYYRAVGETDAYLDQRRRQGGSPEITDKRPSLGRVPLLVIGRVVKTFIGFHYSRLFEREERALKRFMANNYYIGMADYFSKGANRNQQGLLTASGAD